MLYPGSHVLSHLYHNDHKVLMAIADRACYREVIVKCPPYSVLVFFGGTVHRGRRYLKDYGEILNWRVFVSADSDKKWGAVEYHADKTYLPGGGSSREFFDLIDDMLIEPEEGAHVIITPSEF